MVASEKFEQGIKEFNQQQFYACHDTLEAIWVDAEEADKRFYQGILQVAVGCYHLSNDNLRGAIILLGEAVRRLCDYQPDYEGVNVELLLEQASELLQALQQLPEEHTTDFFKQLQHKQSGNEIEPLENQLVNELVANCQIPVIKVVLV